MSIIEVLNNLPPFSFLTAQEKQYLLQNSSTITFRKNAVVCRPDDQLYDFLFIVIEGYVSVNIKNRVRGYIYAPSYFGELAVFFSQPRAATIIAQHLVKCLIIQGKFIRSLVSKNPIFRYSFATVLKDKQRIFLDYQTFQAKLIDNKEKVNFALRELLPFYKKLEPVLHQGSTTTEIDFSALFYVVDRIGFDITGTSSLCISEDLSQSFMEIKNVLGNVLSTERKKYSYNIQPGKVLVLLRDDVSDLINLITKLCLYLIEAQKILNRISGSIKSVALLTKYYLGKNLNISEEEVSNALPFSARELAELKKGFGKKYLKKLYEIVSQQGDIAVQFMPTPVRYYAISSELWINQIRNFLTEHFDQEDLSRRKIHLISSNVHSVRNCLSVWLHQHSKEIVSWAHQHFSDSCNLIDVDQLYVASNMWFKKFPDKSAERKKEDEKQGIYFLEDTCLTGISVTVVDLQKLNKEIDPLLKHAKQNDIIINIDYAYGRQAEIILRCLILLFNTNISSISILGKAGGMQGERGDLLLPDKIMLQEKDDFVYSINQDVSLYDFERLNWQHDIFKGGLLTVNGILMQSKTLLKFYHMFWNIVGLEMEGGYYMRVIHTAKLYGSLDPKVKIRFMYYLSDIPLDPKKNLFVRMSVNEGIPAVYTITRCVLQKILDSDDSK